MKMLKRLLVALGLLIIVGLGALHFFYPLPYVFAVMVDQGPDYYDFRDFPASSIEPGREAQSLPEADDTSAIEALEAHPGIDDVDDFLLTTETTAFLIVHDGQLVLERYGLGHDEASIENTFSIAKSITSALIGVAEAEGVLGLDDPITDHLPELKDRDPRFEQIRIADLLDMRSGIAYSRDIVFPIVNNDDPLVYYHPDLESIVLERPQIESEPGTFTYNNYNPPLLGLILKRRTETSVSEYFEQRIWSEIAAMPAGWTTDKNDMERMESGFHARARDLARFGLLYLNDGRVRDRQIVPSEWVRISTDTDEHIDLEEYDGRRWGYRGGWWIVPRPDGRSDFAAIGHFGQFIYVSPQFDTVFVRNGPGRGDWGDRDWTELFYSTAERLGRSDESEVEDE
ncbi:MAG: serine hydrolase [Woeseiaceae bacterium]|nr:serine hydrolase [Woeseiaceae bacterium]